MEKGGKAKKPPIGDAFDLRPTIRHDTGILHAF